MPGIVGFTREGIEQSVAQEAVERMQGMITYYDFYVRDPLFCDRYIAATRSHINVLQKQPQPFFRHGLYIWLDGEFMNRDKVLGRRMESDLALLAEIFHEKAFALLKNIDGLYSAVIYDHTEGKVHLVVDRYGLRPLYWGIINGELFWSSEVKCALELPGFVPVINRSASEHFINIGYLLDNETWFDGIELVPSGTLLIWNIRTRQLSKERYWWWDHIKAASSQLKQRDAAEMMGDIFRDAVECRTDCNVKTGLTLSGGLDSRAILAAMPDRGYPIEAVTFGKTGCLDAQIAAAVTKIKGARHHFFELNDKVWFFPRFHTVWVTDGQMNFIHMHGMEFRMHISNLFKINMNGFAGDLVLGGSFLKDKLDKPIDRLFAARNMSCPPEMLDNVSLYSDLGKTDYYFLQNRVRRFTSCGTRHALTAIEHRKPFFDNRLIDFVYSFPDGWRRNSTIYKQMLLLKFREFFKDVPWQKTGHTIDCPEWILFMTALPRKVDRRIPINLKRSMYNSINGLLGREVFGERLQNYTNYDIWMRSDPARKYIIKILLNDAAIIYQYYSANKIISCVKNHMSGEMNSDVISRYLTVEIWLQQVFNKKCRFIHSDPVDLIMV